MSNFEEIEEVEETEEAIDKAVTHIRLDATQKSTLNWEDSILEAKQAVGQNARILWELDFGLFDRLLHPLPHLQQFKAFCLAIDHFRETVWSRFAEFSVGACLYHGPLDCIESITATHNERFPDWLSTYMETAQPESLDLLASAYNENSFLARLFCRDIALDYIKQLAGQLPYGAKPMIHPVLTKPLSPVEKAIFFNEEFYRPLELGQREGEEELEGLEIENEEAGAVEGALAICLPSTTHYCPKSIDLLNAACDELTGQGKSFRFIAEEALILRLGGLDELIVVPHTVSHQGKRKLQGFCAAGGRVITLGDKAIGLAQEFPFITWRS
ncbi:MAG: hypothetical protein H0T62_01095 [Parachlamydiaceae bacterium]|nr:hypothetical protein [Parachlamydiaceae bacterium]